MKRMSESSAGPWIGTRVFFQAEDGIRDYKVTGVQTCALPISARPYLAAVIKLRRNQRGLEGFPEGRTREPDHADQPRTPSRAGGCRQPRQQPPTRLDRKSVV